MPVLDRGHSAHLAVVGHAVLRFAFDLVVGGHVLGRLGHRVDAVFFFHQFVDEAPADGGVIHRVVTAEGTFGFGHDKGRAAHAFHAAGNHQIGFTGLDGARCRADGVHARAAQTVDGGTGQLHRQTRQQTAHVSHVAVVFTRLVDAAVKQVGDGRPVDVGVAGHQGFERDRAQIVSAYAGQSAAVTAEGGTDGIANKSLVHGGHLR